MTIIQKWKTDNYFKARKTFNCASGGGSGHFGLPGWRRGSCKYTVTPSCYDPSLPPPPCGAAGLSHHVSRQLSVTTIRRFLRQVTRAAAAVTGDSRSHTIDGFIHTCAGPLPSPTRRFGPVRGLSGTQTSGVRDRDFNSKVAREHHRERRQGGCLSSPRCCISFHFFQHL